MADNEKTATVQAFDGLTFTAEEAGSTIQLVDYSGHALAPIQLEYSSDGGATWSAFDVVHDGDPGAGGTVITLASVGDTVYLRAAPSNRFISAVHGVRRFVMTGKISGSGNLNSLLAASAGSVTAIPAHCYRELFSGCTALTSAPSVPDAELGENCYKYMFSGCTGLTDASAVHISTTSKCCCLYMFTGCTGLTAAPVLSATVMSESCYDSMFSECISLSTAPDLPATEPAKGCYARMFKNCYALSATPVIAAQSMAEGFLVEAFAYSGVAAVTVSFGFTDDVNPTLDWLKNVPAAGVFRVSRPVPLPASRGASTIPAGWSLDLAMPTVDSGALEFTAVEAGATVELKHRESQFFIYSTDAGGTWRLLTEAVTLENAGDEVLIAAYSHMNGVGLEPGMARFALGGRVRAYGSINSLIRPDHRLVGSASNSIFYSLFENCVALTSAPELPATSLGDHCYERLFAGCSSLTSAPELPAGYVPLCAYLSMFEGCTALEQPPALPATRLDVSSYSNMFKGCSALSTAPALPATTLFTACYSGMFCGCTSLQIAPVLPARELASDCYREMFKNCTSLNYIAAAFVDWKGIEHATQDWVSGVQTLSGQFHHRPGLPIEYGPSRIPGTASTASADTASVMSSGWDPIADFCEIISLTPGTPDFDECMGCTDGGAGEQTSEYCCSRISKAWCDGACYEPGTPEHCVHCLGRYWCGEIGDCSLSEGDCCTGRGGEYNPTTHDCCMDGTHPCDSGCCSGCTEGDPCGCNGHYNADCVCVGDETGTACGCAGSGKILPDDCTCSKPLLGDPCGCNDTGTVQDDCSCAGAHPVIGSSCGVGKTWKSCTDCSCIEGYEECGTGCYEPGTADWCSHCVGGGCWDGSTCHQGDQYACEHCEDGCWDGSLCKQPGGTCGCNNEGTIQADCSCDKPGVGDPCGCDGSGTTQPDCSCDKPAVGDDCTVAGGDCSGSSGKIQADCSCVNDCGDGKHPGDACDEGTAVGAKAYDCGCNCVCTNEDERQACHGTWDDVACLCACDADRETACTESGGSFDPVHCDCTCPSGKHLTANGNCECDGFPRVKDTCESDGKHTFVERTCECKCSDESGKGDCESSGGFWNTTDAPCACKCPEDKPLVDGKCTCRDEATLKPICTGAGGEWLESTCKCCYNKTAKSAACSKAGGEWSDKTCSCSCPSDKPVWSDEYPWDCHCADEEQKRTECRQTYHKDFDSANCKCKCTAYDYSNVKPLCTETGSKKGTWDDDHCKCTCGKNMEWSSIYGCQCASKARTACKNNPKKTWTAADCSCTCKNESLSGPCSATGGTWDPDTCKCNCGDLTWNATTGECFCDKTKKPDDSDCTLPNGGIGSWHDCECECDIPDGEQCTNKTPNDSSWLNCICTCNAINQPCTLVEPNDGLVGQDCGCICNHTGNCTVVNENDGEYGDDCECHCAIVDKPCDYKGTLDGKILEDCTCGCAQAHEPCDYKGGTGNGNRDADCNCVCDQSVHKDGESCILDNERWGHWKDCKCEPCSATDAEIKACNDTGTKKWDATKCECVCKALNEECTTEDGIPGHFDKNCDCKACDKTDADCIAPAKLDDNCNCKCNPADFPPNACPTGKHLMYIEGEGCKCGCDKDKNSCNDDQTWNKQTCHCDCKANLPKCPDGKHRDPETCKCEDCKLTAETAGCREEIGQYFDPDSCSCKCGMEKNSCGNGKHRNDQCDCVCDKDASMCVKGLNHWVASICDCVCDDPDKCVEVPGTHPDANCNCVCDVSASSCDPAKQVWNEETCHCDCRSDLGPCTDADGNTWERDENCDCFCEDDGSCNPLKQRFAGFPICGCVCTGEKPKQPGENFEWVETDCEWRCLKTASELCPNNPNAFNPEKCDCDCDKSKCTDETKPDLNEDTCECYCDAATRSQSCKTEEGETFDEAKCKCMPCENVDAAKENRDPQCWRWDGKQCDWVEDTSKWRQKVSAFKSAMARKVSALENAIANAPTSASYPTIQGCDMQYMLSGYTAADVSSAESAIKANLADINGFVSSAKTAIGEIESLISHADTAECGSDLGSASEPNLSGLQAAIQAVNNNMAVLDSVAMYNFICGDYRDPHRGDIGPN